MAESFKEKVRGVSDPRNLGNTKFLRAPDLQSKWDPGKNPLFARQIQADQVGRCGLGSKKLSFEI